MQVLLGDHYGSAAIPVTLTLKDYQFLHKAASVSTNDAVNTTLLEECYKRDDNIIPPAYVLQVRVIPWLHLGNVTSG